MSWLVGIDEAGYGSNLGPLVQAAVAVRLDPGVSQTESTLDLLFRRCHHPADDRVLIDDSKKVYSGRQGLKRLEASVLTTVPVPDRQGVLTIDEWLRAVASESVSDLENDPWYDGKQLLPVHEGRDSMMAWRERFQTQRHEAGIVDLHVISVITSPRLFNQQLNEGKNKADIAGDGIGRLIHRLEGHFQAADKVEYVIDRQGGRKHYRDWLGRNYLGYGIVAVEEKPSVSRYCTVGELRRVWTFAIEAECRSWMVAWASMICKYIRELLMLQFNRYWQSLRPGLKATAGYPSDARRFFTEIEPLLDPLGINQECIWRRR